MPKPSTVASPLNPAPTVVTPDSHQIARSIAETVLILRDQARTAKLKTLQGLLEITYQEAISFAEGEELPQPDPAMVNLIRRIFRLY